MFIHKPIELGYKSLACVTRPAGRKYTTPAGKEYPSITTVIGKTSDQTWLDEWRDRVGQEEVDRTCHHGCVRGEMVHNMCEYYLDNKDPMTLSKMPHHRFAFSTMKKTLDEHVNNIRMQEAPLYSDHLRMAGRVDLIAEYDGVLSIIDFKTSKEIKKASEITGYFMQKAGYAVMIEERTGIPITQLVTLMVVDNVWETAKWINHRDDWIGELIQRRKAFDLL